MEQFEKAVSSFGTPSRVRCDFGGENNAVCLFMELFRGQGSGSAMRGRGTHNQRIERLWGDLWRGLVNVYHSLFTLLEEEGTIDVMNEKHMWALQYVYLPRINRDLDRFVSQWNHHKLRTARYQSPYQIFVRGSLEMQRRGLTAIQTIFGEDDTGPTEIEGAPNAAPQVPQSVVVVPDNTFALSEQHQERVQQINPLGGDRSSLGVDVLQEVLGFLALHYP